MNENEIEQVETEINNKNAVEDRVRKAISDKKEAEAKVEISAKAQADAELKLAEMQKETNFLNSFTDVTAKFPTATEYKDKIKEKVMSGYSVDDATVSVLHAEGKYQAPVQKIENVTGGSAPNQITGQPSKTVQEMSNTERWDALKEAEKRGDISLS